MASIRHSRVRSITILGLIILALVLLHGTGILKPIENLVILVLNPIQRAIYPLGIKFLDQDSTISAEQLAVEKAKLEEKVSQLTIEKAKLLTAAANSTIIEQELSYLNEKQQQGVIAHIINKSAEGQQQVLTINKGEKDGILVGQAVIAEKGIIIGKISSASAYASQVLLLTDKSSRLAVAVLNDQKSPGIIMGKHGLALTMEMIPQNEKIDLGQIIITSGQESGIPPDLIVGAIESINSKQEELFQSATVSLLISYERLTVVMVILTNLDGEKNI